MSCSGRPSGGLHVCPRRAALTFEPLEARLLLDGTAPYFATPLEANYFSASKSLAIDIDAGDADPGDIVSISAVSKTPGLTVSVPAGNVFAELQFVKVNGVTPIGNIIVDLFQVEGGQATQRFITLATNHVNDDGSLDPTGVPFYTDVVVHRVIPGFMIQSGDAVNGDGTGGSPLGTFPDSFYPGMDFSAPGVLAMANSGADTNDCQFFVTDAPATWLNGIHMIFGQMLAGEDVLRAIIASPRDSASDRPYWTPYLHQVEIMDRLVICQGQDGFAGDAVVTITLTDSHGNTTSQDVTITVDGTIRVQPGQERTFAADLTGLSNPQVSSTFSPATVSLDVAAGTISVQTPDTFTGIFQIELTDDGNFVHEFCVVSQRETGPQLVSLVPAEWGNVSCTARSSGYLYVGRSAMPGSTSSVLDVYDVSNPLNPLAVASIGQYFYDVVDMQVVGDILYVLDMGSSGSSLTSVDVSDPQAIHVITSADFAGVALSMTISGNLAAVANTSNGLTVLGLTSDGQSIWFMRSVTDAPGATILEARDVAVYGSYVYTSCLISVGSDQFGTILVFDISNPSAPVFRTFIPSYAPLGLDIDGNLLYVADLGGGVSLYNISRPLSPKLIKAIPTPNDEPRQVDAEGGYVAVLSSGGMILLDVTDLKHPLTAYYFAQYNDPNDYRPKITLSGGTIYGPSAERGVVLVDATHTFWVQTHGTIIDENGVPVTFTVGRDSVARITTAGFRSGKIEVVELFGPDKTSLTIKTPSRTITSVGEIIVYGSASQISAKSTDLKGDLRVDGLLTKLTLRNANEAEIKINASGGSVAPKAGLTVMLAEASDLEIDTGGLPLRSLTVTSWTDGDAQQDNDKVIAPQLKKLSAKYDFAANLELVGLAGVAQTLGTTRIGGNLLSTRWDVTGDTGKITVIGSLSGEGLFVSGKISGLTVGTSDDDTYLIQAGVLVSLAAKYNFAPSLNLAGMAGVVTLGKAKIGGDLTSTRWDVAGDMGKVTVVGSLSGDGMFVTGKISGLTLGDCDSGSYVILAAALAKLAVKYDFAPILVLGSPAGGQVLGTAKIGGDLLSSWWIIMGSAKGITVSGAARSARVSATGNIDSLTLGAAYGSNFLAGFDSTFTKAAKNMVHSDFLNAYNTDPLAPPTIKKVTIKGWKVPKGQVPPRFVDDSNFIAARIGTVSLLNADPSDVRICACLTGSPLDVKSVKHKDTAPPFVGDPVYNWSWPSTSTPMSDVMIRIL